MRQTALLVMVLGLAAGRLPAAETGTRYACFQAATEPRIDGDVTGDPAWQAMPAATGFRVLGGGYAQAKQTTIRMCWSADALILGVVCEEPHAASLKPTAKDGGWTWAEDSIEAFLVPVGGGQAYQIGVTAGGAKGSGEGGPDIARCTAAARILEDAYSLELRIPYGVLAASPPAEGTVWHGTVCRNTQTVTPSGGDKFTCWSPLQARFLEPENFAAIEFHERALTLEEAAAETEALNRPYRDTLTGQLTALARRAEDYREALQGAVGHPRLGSRAQELLAAWQRIEAVDRQAEKAAIRDVRQALLSAGTILHASHETKYAALLEKLVEEP